MSLSTILFLVILGIAVTVPFILMKRNNMKATAALLKQVSDYASQINAELTEYQVLNGQVIALSAASKSIIFFKQCKGKAIASHVYLHEVERCYVDRPSRSSVDGRFSSIAKIALRFVFADRRPEVAFELYDIEVDGLSIDGELQMAEKWREIVNAQLLVMRVR
jgi:hypothetical protein